MGGENKPLAENGYMYLCANWGRYHCNSQGALLNLPEHQVLRDEAAAPGSRTIEDRFLLTGICIPVHTNGYI